MEPTQSLSALSFRDQHAALSFLSSFFSREVLVFPSPLLFSSSYSSPSNFFLRHHLLGGSGSSCLLKEVPSHLNTAASKKAPSVRRYSDNRAHTALHIYTISLLNIRNAAMGNECLWMRTIPNNLVLYIRLVRDKLRWRESASKPSSSGVYTNMCPLHISHPHTYSTAYWISLYERYWLPCALRPCLHIWTHLIAFLHVKAMN